MIYNALLRGEQRTARMPSIANHSKTDCYVLGLVEPYLNLLCTHAMVFEMDASLPRTSRCHCDLDR
ncbi:hypothetical protein VCHA54P500_10033 [Vibrio chagasii]|nr:hypothetical protein VCHA34P117_10348 [Vibrio chagasii]CAH6992700.1 hypothetical protein VCHA34P112_40145 [Vibrio chagasii]CAH7005708.1 hypothetical protein VCHA48P439_10033 [Vibrio chagasii]CAH7049764.1 hypothetical protein VCHA40O236_10348 [Vibrio chagasii]CAH7068724.1 hypothetical protein VCHA54P500_10033 [Vibrio chagasii]